MINHCLNYRTAFIKCVKLNHCLECVSTDVVFGINHVDCEHELMNAMLK